MHQGKRIFEEFVRFALPTVKNVRAHLPSLAPVSVVRTDRGIKYVDSTEPNWWQLPGEVRSVLLGSDQGVQL